MIAAIAIALVAAAALVVIGLMLSRSPSAERAAIAPARKPELRETVRSSEPPRGRGGDGRYTE